MMRKVSLVLGILGIVLVLLSIVGFIPKVSADYDATSTLFILGLVFLVIAFFLKRASGGKGVKKILVKRKKKKR